MRKYVYCHKILISDQILLKLKLGLYEYPCLPCVGTKHIKVNGNGFFRHFFNDTVYMEFRVCFTTAKYENNVFSLCKTKNAFIDAFAIPKSIFISQDRLN